MSQVAARISLDKKDGAHNRKCNSVNALMHVKLVSVNGQV
jgi:hypothetical protein